MRRIALYAASHTGYQMVRELFYQHPEVVVLSPDEFAFQSGWGIGIAQAVENGLDVILNPKRLESAIEGAITLLRTEDKVDTRHNEIKAVIFAGHTHYEWLDAMVDTIGFDEIVTPIRDPHRVCESYYKRGDTQDPMMSRYIRAVMKGRTFVPVDVISGMTSGSRMDYFRGFFSMLGLSEPKGGLQSLISSWPKMGYCVNPVPITDSMRKEIDERIKRSDVYTCLKRKAIYYYDYD